MSTPSQKSLQVSNMQDCSEIMSQVPFKLVTLVFKWSSGQSNSSPMFPAVKVHNYCCVGHVVGREMSDREVLALLVTGKDLVCLVNVLVCKFI